MRFSSVCGLFLSVCLAFASVCGAEQREVTVAPGLFELRVEGGGKLDAAWDARQPVDLPFRDYLLGDGDAVLLAIGKPGDRLVIQFDGVDWEAKARKRIRFTVAVSGDPIPPGPGPSPPGPGPGPAPGPRPNGFAGEVFDQACKLGKPADCLKLSAVHESFVSQFAAGGFVGKTAQQLMAELGTRNKAAGLGAEWRPFGDWLGDQVASRAIIAEDIRDLSAQIAAGLAAAGGKAKGKR